MYVKVSAFFAEPTNVETTKLVFFEEFDFINSGNKSPLKSVEVNNVLYVETSSTYCLLTKSFAILLASALEAITSFTVTVFQLVPVNCCSLLYLVMFDK